MAVSETQAIKVLPRRVIQQPEPLLSPGGDCGACVAGGVIVGQTNPGRLAVEKAYKMRDGDEGPKSVSRYKMIEILNEARHQGMVEDYIEDIPMWAPRQDFQQSTLMVLTLLPLALTIYDAPPLGAVR